MILDPASGRSGRKIIEKTFKHRQGQALDGSPLRGKPLLLEPWQKFVVYATLVFFIPGTIERRVKEAFIYVPRKNGKTLFIAALSWALGILERMSGSTVYVVGAVLKEAMKSYEHWYYNLTSVLYADKQAATSDGWRILDNNMEHSISHDDLDGRLLPAIRMHRTHLTATLRLRMRYTLIRALNNTTLSRRP